MIGSRSTVDQYANGDSRHLLRVVMDCGIHRQILSGSVRFWSVFCKIIIEEVGWVLAIQSTGGRSAYNVVDEAS